MTLLSDFCTIYQIPKIQEKLNTLYPNFDQKLPYTWIKMGRDTVYPKPLAGPEIWWKKSVFFIQENVAFDLSVTHSISSWKQWTNDEN